MALVHGTCIAIHDTGVLLRGAPGSGKSDLALRLIDGGAHLVADDQVSVTAADAGPAATAPSQISGMIEVRGIGIVEMPAQHSVVLACVFDLVPAGDIDRLPEPATTEIAGHTLPCFRIDPTSASAAAKVRLVVDRLRNA